MKLFGRIFGSKPSPTPAIRFGRYTDANRSAAREGAMDAALRDFHKENHLAAYVSFFDYLLDEEQQNLRAWEERGELRFELYQGSKKVTGYANAQKFYAEARIAKAKALQACFMRRLLDANFELKYSRFALTPDDEIAITFDSHLNDGSPYKLYAALKELATIADKHDDLLVDEYEALEITDFNVRRELPAEEKATKIAYIQQEIRDVFEEMDSGSLPAEQYPVAYTYLLLDLCYRLDYLTKPEGFMMETLERIDRTAFAQDGRNAAQKNLALRQEFQQLLDRPTEKMARELYEVSTTFGITPSIDHQKLALLIDQELPNMRWYADHGHERIAKAIPGFIVGRALFSYAMPPPDRDLFHLLMQVLESDYFLSLGFQPLAPAGLLDEKAIKQALRSIVNQYEAEYPRLSLDAKRLDFRSVNGFAASFLMMVREVDLGKG
ncbi:MAG: YbjN domain-containing protein [Saprospiraceae bacterium]|jgi:hypothetical protein|nr:YbjN domain-containing protein [Saprospiraceae bacterium]